MSDGRWSIAIHGGAGTMDRAAMSAAQRAEYEAALGDALDAGVKVLADGGSALDAVEAAVVVLEDDPHFNAGRGSVFTYNGTSELDAAIMDGRDRSAGAAAGLTHVKNPVRLARAVMEQSPHVFLCGAGAEEFARGQDIEIVDPDWETAHGHAHAALRYGMMSRPDPSDPVEYPSADLRSIALMEYEERMDNRVGRPNLIDV